jgi:hypothetical protein
MAVRRDTIKQQFGEAIGGVLEGGEQVLAGTLAQSGPTPWLAGGVGFIVMYRMGMRLFFVAATDRRIVFMRASLWTQRPRGLAFADIRGAGQLTDVVADAKIWNSFKYTRPGETKPVRFNVSNIIWKEEYQQLLNVLSQAPGVASTPPPPPAP